jgi:hypothetical protein
LNTGLAALVMLSLFDAPVSDPDWSVIVAVGAVRSMVTVDPFVSAFVFPAVSVTADAARRTITVPSVQPVAVMV